MYDDDIFLAQTLQPTTTGMSVNITYWLQVELDYDTYWADIPKWSIPMFIQAPELQNFFTPTAPANWNPQIFDEVNLALPVPVNELKQYNNQNIPHENRRLLEDEKYNADQNYLPPISYSQGVPAPVPVSVSTKQIDNQTPYSPIPVPVPVSVPKSIPQSKSPHSEWDV